MTKLTGVAVVLLTANMATAQSVEIGGSRMLETPDAWEFVGSAWTLKDGRLTQASTRGRPCAFYRPAVLGDVSVQVRFRAHDDGNGVKAAGLILRSTDSQNAFLIHYDSRNDQIIVTRDGIGEDRHEVGRKRKVKIETGQWYTARTDVTGDEIKVFLDEKLLLTAKDTTLSAGRVGVYTSQGKIEFEGFQVTGRKANLSSPWRMRMTHEVPKEQATATILSTKVICKQPGRYIGWPTVCCRRNGELLAAFSGDRHSHVCPWGKVQMVRSSDNGETWSEPVSICNTPLDDRDAGIIETRTGTLVVAWFTSLAFESQAKSRRGKGVMWDEWYYHAEKLTPEIRKQWMGYWTTRSEDGGKTWDPPVKTKGSAPHGAIQLADGRLLYVGRCLPHRNTELTVEESRDDGRSWQQIASIRTAPEDPITQFHEPHVVETAEGDLVAQFRYHHVVKGKPGYDNTQSFLRQSESTDGGKTWTVAQKIPLLGYPPHLIRLRNGWLLTVYGRRYGAYGEYACISRDGGATWDVENEIKLASAINGDLGYPASTQLPDGSILTVFYQVDKPGEKTCLLGTHWQLKGAE